jgi:DNA-3-methyladenine glycosylase
VVEVARDLLGCVVVRGDASGMVVETEAYHESEPACHAHIGRTARTVTLFGPPGRAYVYRSYGIHAMLNVVCEPEGIGAAVLIRALHPVSGIELMCERRGRPLPADLCSGPGKLTQALGIEFSDNGTEVSRGPVVVCAPAAGWEPVVPAVGVRIGITKAAELPWRFALPGHPAMSRPRLAAAVPATP